MAPNSAQRDSGSQRESQPNQGSAAAHPEADTYHFADFVRSSVESIVRDAQRPSTDPGASRDDLTAMRRSMGVADGTGPGYGFADNLRRNMPRAQPDGSENAERPTSGTGPGYNFADVIRASVLRNQSGMHSGAASGAATDNKKYEAPGNQAKKARGR
ncbi:hypothetical protein ACJ6WF_18335 [Streptomyces sp. MMS24-I2-30]|uniref:hypothetical protein n=1 Tax=Streptomyces sp. MMS24-I2-30 TaxID=3351564 RepID=UPI003896DDF8